MIHDLAFEVVLWRTLAIAFFVLYLVAMKMWRMAERAADKALDLAKRAARLLKNAGKHND